MVRISSWTVAAFCCLSFTAGEAFELPGQAVTWADFNRVFQVSSSMTHAYFATTSGIIRYSILDNRWEEPLSGTIGIDHLDIRRVWVNQFDDRLYAKTSHDFYEYDRTLEKWFVLIELPRIENDNVHLSPPRTLYPPHGFFYSREEGLSDTYGRRFDFNDIVDDNTDNLWIASWGTGPIRAGKTSAIVELMPFGLIQNRVDAIFYDNGDLIVSGAATEPYRSGITIFDPDANESQFIESGLNRDFPLMDIYCLNATEEFILAGSSYGLLLIERNRHNVKRRIDLRRGLSHDYVTCLEVKGDSIYIGTEEGLNLYRLDENEIQRIEPGRFAAQRINDLLLIDNWLWIAARNGVFRLQTETGKLQRFQDPENFLFGDIYSMKLNGDDLWIASADGILRLNLETALTWSFPVSSLHFQPRSLAVNDSIAVVADQTGMTFIFYSADPPFSRDFTTDDGLPSNFIHTLEMDGDFIWVGSDMGLTRFLWNNPDRVD